MTEITNGLKFIHVRVYVFQLCMTLTKYLYSTYRPLFLGFICWVLN